MSKLKLQSLITAFLVYVTIIAAIFFALFFKKDIPKAKSYTEKKSEIIEVSLGSPTPKTVKKTTKKKSQSKKKRKKKKHIKKVRNNKKKSTKHTKKIVKTKHKKVKNSTKKSVKKASKPDTNKLFGSIKDDLSTNDKPKGKNGKSSNKENRSKGVVNKYLANIQNTLQGWPAQSNFAGEKIRVELTVYSSGLFDYKILHRSLNPEFNEALKTYLEQLKKFGFGSHSNAKALKIIVEFIAKD